LARNTRERIAQGARELFFKEGFDGMRLERLAGELGITKRTIYNHFESKEDLLFAVLEEDLRKWIEDMRITVRDPDLEMGERFLLLQSRAAEHLTHTVRVFPRVMTGPKYEMRRRVISDFMGELAGVMTEVVDLARRTGYLLPDTDPELMAHVLINIGDGLPDHCDIASVPYDAPTLLTESVRMVLCGVLTELGRRRLEEMGLAPGIKNGEA